MIRDPGTVLHAAYTANLEGPAQENKSSAAGCNHEINKNP